MAEENTDDQFNELASQTNMFDPAQIDMGLDMENNLTPVVPNSGPKAFKNNSFQTQRDTGGLAPYITPRDIQQSRTNPNLANDWGDSLLNKSAAEINTMQNKRAYAPMYTFDSSPKGAFKDRYKAYGQETYNKIGFNPMMDNESWYNANTSFGDDLSRTIKTAALPMLGLGFMSPLHSYHNMAQGESPFNTSDEEASEYDYLNQLAYSSKGGIGGFTNNLVLSAGYSAGILLEGALEGALIGGAVGFAEGGIGAVPGAALGGAAGFIKNLARLPKSLYQSVKAMGNLGKTLQKYSNLAKSKQLWNKAAGNIGKFINPLDNTIDAIKTSDNLNNLARYARTAGGFWNDVKNVNMALSEGRLEGGFTKQQTYDELYNEYYNEHGVAPSIELQQTFMEKAGVAGWQNSLQNTALVFYSNKIAFPSITRARFLRGMPKLTSGTTVIGRANKEFQVVFDPGKKITDGLYSAERIGIKNALKSVTKPKVWGDVGWNYFKANIVEGFQETSQDILNDATKDYYKAGIYSPDAKTMRYALGTLSEAIGKQVSAQGAETFASGFFMGTILQLPGKMVNATSMGYNRFFKHRKNWDAHLEQSQKNADDTVAALNNMYKDAKFFFDPRFNNFSNQMLAAKIIDSDDATEKEIDDAAFASFTSSVMTSLNNGTFDMFLNNLKEYKQASTKDIEEAWNLERGQGQIALDSIDDNIKAAENMSKKYQMARKKMKALINLADFKPGSEEHKKALIYNSAYQLALQNLVFMQSSFEKNLKKQEELFKRLAEVDGLKSLNFSEISSIVDPGKLSREIAMLETDLEGLRSNPNASYQADINQDITYRQSRIDALKTFQAAQDNLLNAAFANKITGQIKSEMLERDNQFDEESTEIKVLNELMEDYENGETNEFVEYKEAFKNLLLSTAATEEDTVRLELEFNNSDRFDYLFDSLMDMHVIKNENSSLASYVNLLSNPNDFYNHVDANFKFMKDLYTNRERYFRDVVESNQSAIEKNALLNELADRGIFVDLEQFAEWVENHDNLPEYFIDQTNKRVINKDSVLYNEYAELFEQAAEADEQREARPNITDEEIYNKRVDEIETSRSKALDDEKEKFDSAFKEKFGNTFDELLKEIDKREVDTEQERIDLVTRMNLLGSILNQLESNDYVLLEGAYQSAVEEGLITEEQFQESVERLITIPESLQKLNKAADKIKADVDESVLRDTQIAGAFQKLILSAYLTDVKDELQEQINNAETDVLVAVENADAYILDPINVSYKEAVEQINQEHDALLDELKQDTEEAVEEPTSKVYTTSTPFADFAVEDQEVITPLFDEFLNDELEEGNIKDTDPDKYSELRDRWLLQQTDLVKELNAAKIQRDEDKAKELLKPPTLKFLPFTATRQTKAEDLGRIYNRLETILRDGEYALDSKKPNEKVQLTTEDIENINSDIEALRVYMDAMAAAFEPKTVAEEVVNRIAQTIINRRNEVVEITDVDGNVTGRRFADKEDTDPRPTRVTNVAEKVKQDLTGDPQFRYSPIEKTEDGQPGPIENLFNTIFESEKLPTLNSKVDKFISRFRELAYSNYKNSFGSEKKLAVLEKAFREVPTFETLSNVVKKLASKHYSDGGNTVDILTRMFLTPKAEQDGSGFIDFDYESTVDMKGFPVKISDVMSKEAFDALFKTGSGIVSKLREGVIDGEWQILSENVLLFDKNLLGNGITGEIDILAVDTKGNVKIIDIKTGQPGTWERFGTGQKFDKETYFRAQQSIYSDLFYNMSGISVTSIGLLPLQMDVTIDGYINSIVRPPMMAGITDDTIEIEYLPEIIDYGIERIEPNLKEIERETAGGVIQVDSKIPSSDTTKLSLKDNIGNLIIYQGQTGKLVQLPNGRYGIETTNNIATIEEIRLEMAKNDLAMAMASDTRSEDLVESLQKEIKDLEKTTKKIPATITEVLFNLQPVTDGNISLMDVGIQPITTIEFVGQQRIVNNAIVNAKFDNTGETIATINGVKYDVERDSSGSIVSLSYKRNDDRIKVLKQSSTKLSNKIFQLRNKLKNTPKLESDVVRRQIVRAQSEKKRVDSEIRNLSNNNPVVKLRGGNLNDYIFALNMLPNSFQKITKDRTISDEKIDLKTIGRLSINASISEAIDGILAENYPEAMDVLIDSGLDAIAYRDGQELISWVKDSILKLEQLGFDLINKDDIVDDIVRQINSLNLLLSDLELINLNKDGKISKRQKGEVRELFDPTKVQERSSLPADAKSQRPKKERVLRPSTKEELKEVIRKQRRGGLEVLQTEETAQENPLITDIKESNASTIKAAYEKAFLEANKDGSELNLDAVQVAYNTKLEEINNSMNIENLIPGETYVRNLYDDGVNDIYLVKSKKGDTVSLENIVSKEITDGLGNYILNEAYERITEEKTMELEIKPEDQEIAKENIADLKKLSEDKEAIDEAKTNATENSREDLLKKLKDNSENCS